MPFLTAMSVSFLSFGRRAGETQNNQENLGKHTRFSTGTRHVSSWFFCLREENQRTLEHRVFLRPPLIRRFSFDQAMPSMMAFSVALGRMAAPVLALSGW